MSRLRITGTVLVILGGLLFVLALAFLPYISADFFSHREPTLWDLTTREPVILTVVGVAAIVSAAGSLLTDKAALLVLATLFSFYLFGRIFPPGAPTYSLFGVGFWVATAAAFAMSMSGVLAVAGGISFANRLAKPS